MLILVVKARVPTGQGKLEEVREFVWSGKVKKKSAKNIIFEKSWKMILDYADCRCLWFFVSPNIKKQAYLHLPSNIQKLDVF